MTGVRKLIGFPRNRHRFLDFGFTLLICVFLIFVSLANGTPRVLSSFPPRHRKPPHQSSNFHSFENVPSVTDDEVCHTKVCNETASLFLNNMDRTVDPCDNFYQYACGNFEKNTKIEDHQYVAHNFAVLEYEISKQLSQSLNTSSGTRDKKPLKLLKKLYQSCMNIDKINAEGISEVTKIIKSLGGWPAIDRSWNEDNFNWFHAIYQLRQLGYHDDIFFGVKISDKSANVPKREIQISRPSFDLVHHKYMEQGLQNEKVEAYLKYIIDLAEAFGAQNPLDDMLSVLNFQIELAKIAPSTAVNFEKMYIPNLHTIMDIHWIAYINAQMPHWLKFDKSESAKVDLNYILRLESLLNQTPKSTIANYIMTQVVLSLVPFLSNDVRAHQLRFFTKMHQVSKFPERWQECISHTSRLLPIAMSSVYVKDHFSREYQPTDDVRNMFGYLKDEFVNMFQKSKWMDYRTQLMMLSKLSTMSASIRYSKELTDDSIINEYYRGLKLSEDSFLKIALKLQKFNIDNRIAVADDDLTEYSWTMLSGAMEVNAHYVPSINTLHIPAGLMHGVFFNKHQPKYVNYGTLGFTVAREMARAFDIQGVQFDKDNRDFSLLSKRKKRQYQLRAQCLVGQYSNYTVKGVGVKLNGLRNFNDNLDDNVGLRADYNAYLKWIEEHGHEKKLPRIDRTPNQLFWLSFANALCSKYRENYINHSVIVDSQTPAEPRVLLSLKNMQEFAEDYQCPLGSNMNPRDRCPPFFGI